MCGNVNNAANLQSLRYLGPSDVSAPSISIYNGVAGGTHGGAELTFTALAGNNFGFVPTGFVLTGRSSWTAFFNDNFTGNSTCYTTSALMVRSAFGTTTRSILQGCNAKYNSVYIDLDKDVQSTIVA